METFVQRYILVQDPQCLNKNKDQNETIVEVAKYNDPKEGLKDVNAIARLILAHCPVCKKANKANTCPNSPKIIKTETIIR